MIPSGIKASVIIRDFGDDPEPYLVDDGKYDRDELLAAARGYPHLVAKYLDLDDPRVHDMFSEATIKKARQSLRHAK